MQTAATPEMLEALQRMLTTDIANDEDWFSENPEADVRIRECTKDELLSGGMSPNENLETHVLKLPNGSLVKIVAEEISETQL